LNTGNLSDTFQLTWSHTQAWSAVTLTTPVSLLSGGQRIITVTVNVPGDSGIVGQHDTMVITATSVLNPSLQLVVTDVTLIPRARVFLPVILR
jgi:hypothetical protein